MDRKHLTIAIAAVFGLLAVIAGAAGTHALRDALDAGALRTFETAARFQMYHALALLAVGVLSMRWQTRALAVSAALFTLGILLETAARSDVPRARAACRRRTLNALAAAASSFSPSLASASLAQ